MDHEFPMSSYVILLPTTQAFYVATLKVLLGEDIKNRVQFGMYLDWIVVEEIQMYTE